MTTIGQDPQDEQFDQPEPMFDCARGHVLIVDDNEVNRQVCAMFCDLLGLSFERAQNVDQAIDALRRTYFDLVLIDIGVPGVDGLGAVFAIRRLQGPARNIPIIAVTTAVASDDISLYEACGINEVVAKPVVGPKLVAAITTALQHPLETRGVRAA